MKNQKGMSLISTLVALAVMSILIVALTDITVTMVKTNTTAMVNSDIVNYVDQLRGDVQSSTNSSLALIGNNMVSGPITIQDPVTGIVIASPNYKVQPTNAWSVKNLRFDNVTSVPSQANLFRGTLVVVFQLDSGRVIGPTIKVRTVGDVYCLTSGGTIQSCYGSTDLVTLAKDNCNTIGGSWDPTKAFGTQCVVSQPAPSIPVVPLDQNPGNNGQDQDNKGNCGNHYGEIEHKGE